LFARTNLPTKNTPKHRFLKIKLLKISTSVTALNNHSNFEKKSNFNYLILTFDYLILNFILPRCTFIVTGRRKKERKIPHKPKSAACQLGRIPFRSDSNATAKF